MITPTDTKNIDFDYFSDEYANEDDHEGTVSMAEFDDSFNMIVGSADLELNLMDNRFINFKVYVID